MTGLSLKMNHGISLIHAMSKAAPLYAHKNFSDSANRNANLKPKRRSRAA